MFINHASREINVKLVYAGAPRSGKVENLQYIYDRLDPASRGKMISAVAPTGTTVFFDFLPPGLGQIRGYTVRMHLYTLADDEQEIALLPLLKGIDGVVFVVDGRTPRGDDNARALALLQAYLAEHGRSLDTVPRAYQLNGGAAADLALDGPTVAANSADGSGVFDTLKAATREILLAMKDGRLG